MRGRKKHTAQQRRTIAYVRVSTEDQAREGVSLDAQRARIEAYAALQGVVVDEVIVDAGESAKTLQRPGFERVLGMVQSGEVSMLIVTKLDRATRSVRDLANLVDLFAKHHVSFVSLSESLDTATAAGRMMLHLLGVFAEFERAMIGERTSAALAHKRSQRQAYSPTPYGFRRDGDHLVPDDDQQFALVLMRDLQASGASLRGIAESLTDRGIMPARGSRWYASSVRAVLTSRMALDEMRRVVREIAPKVDDRNARTSGPAISPERLAIAREKVRALTALGGA
jgi:site-specific DNA recombinase